jgi:hypothetical protein
MKNITTKVDGDSVDAAEWNPAQAELMNAVKDTGQTLNESDNYQVSKAMAMYACNGDYFNDIGTANNFLLTAIGNEKLPYTYVDGLRIRFKPANTNTTSSNVTVQGLSARLIKKFINGVAINLSGGELVAGVPATLAYNSSSGWFELIEIAQSTEWVTGEITEGYMASKTGWLLLNDTWEIGSAASTAHYKRDDAYSLFILLWNAQDDTKCPVTGGRGVSAGADWLANKNLMLPKHAGRTVGATGSGTGITTRALGDSAGEETHTLITSEIPNHRHSTTEVFVSGGSDRSGSPGNGGNGFTGYTGGGNAHNNIQPTTFLNRFIKL